MRLPPDPNAPLRHKFRGPAFDSHIECWPRRFRRLGRNFLYLRRFPAGFLQNRVDPLEPTDLGRRRLLGWLRIMFAGDSEGFLEILDIEPGLGADAFQQAVFP